MQNPEFVGYTSPVCLPAEVHDPRVASVRLVQLLLLEQVRLLWLKPSSTDSCAEEQNPAYSIATWLEPSGAMQTLI